MKNEKIIGKDIKFNYFYASELHFLNKDINKGKLITLILINPFLVW